MLNYIKGEIFRLIHKKSMYTYFGFMFIGYALITFMRSGGFDEASVTNDALTLFMMLPVMIGGFMFMAIYLDDLNAKSLVALVGFGMSKAQIIVAKLILSLLFNGILFGIFPIFHWLLYVVFGSGARFDALSEIYIITLRYGLLTIGYSALVAALVYGVQRATLPMVVYVVAAFGTIYNLLAALVLNPLAESGFDLGSLFVFEIVNRISIALVNGEPILTLLIGYILYVGIASVVSTVVFHKKEMEF